MSLKCLLLLTTTAVAVVNGGLLGHITYAGQPVLDHHQHHQPLSQFSDATKVSYSSVSRPIYAAPQPVYAQYQQQVNYPLTSYAQYSPAAFVPQQQSYQAIPAAIYQHQAPQQSYNAASSFIQNSQYPGAQFTVAHQPAVAAYTSGYGQIQAAAALGEAPLQYQSQQQQFYGNHQQYATIQQSVPVQSYQSVQPLQQPITAQPALPAQKTVSIQQFPAQQPVNYNHLPASPQNAHHYPATISKPANVVYQPIAQQAQQHSAKTSNSVFRTSFSVAAAPAKPTQDYLPSAPVAAPSQVLLSPVGPTVASRSSLTKNPINIPSPSPGLIAPVQAHQKQIVQPASQQVKSYSPSTSVSHTKFEGMGVHYEW